MVGLPVIKWTLTSVNSIRGGYKIPQKVLPHTLLKIQDETPSFVVFRGRVSQLTNRNGHSKFVRGMELPTAGKLVLVYLWAVTMAREHHIGLTQA